MDHSHIEVNMRLIGEQFSECRSGMIPEGGFEIIGVWRDTDGHLEGGKRSSSLR